jgi:glycosyltransferase involved in cell wall biosynthesis
LNQAGAAPRPPRPCRTRIGVSLGDVGTLAGGGLPEFCLQVGSRLQALVRQHLGPEVGLVFNVRPGLLGCFGDGVDYLAISRWQRYRHLRPEPYALWHSLHQLNKNLPPAGAGVRLVTVHDLNFRYGSRAFSRWRHNRRTRALLARTDRLTAISHYTARDLREHLGWAGEIEVIHNGARSFVGQPQQPLAGWSAVPDKPFLFHLSRMAPVKNPQALMHLAAAWPEMTLVLAGPDNADARALRAAHQRPNLQFHLGITEAQKAWCYAQCTGFVFPSLAEGFGLPPLEAMHFGKPVFLSRLTSLPEVGGDCADYFDSFEPAAMRAVVQQGLARHAAEPARADALRAHAAQFNWDRAAQHYVALYGRLLGLGSPP